MTETRAVARVGPRQPAGLADRLLASTLELVDIPSVSGEEDAILERVAGRMSKAAFELVDHRDGVLCYLPRARRRDVPLVLLVGHVDTVPVGGGLPGGRDERAVEGRGAADMKGGVAVMLALAEDLGDGPETELDVGMLFAGREELPISESAVVPLLERCAAVREADLAVVLEPTGNVLQLGCMGNLTARVRLRGEAAHSARPWLGDNAIHRAIRTLAPIADLPPRDVEVDGLVFREVVSVTSIEGGIASNVVPDLAAAEVNLRYAPSHEPAEAEARLRELLQPGAVEIEILGNAPPAPTAADDPLVVRLREAGRLEHGPKQAWTPVAELAQAGVAAVNFGPGDPRYAHADDERVEGTALVRTYEVVRAFLTGRGAEGAP